MDLLADFLSGDPHRIWSASCAVRTLRDPAVLQHLATHRDRIRASASTVPLGGMVRANSTHLDFALTKLAFVADAAGCLCLLYTRDDLYDPAKEEKAGNVRVVSTVMRERFVDHYLCECTPCGARYRVVEGVSHYTWWRWVAAEAAP